VSAAAIAEVGFSCGRHYLSVAAIILAMEGDKCRDGNLPEDVYEPISTEELAAASIGGRPVRDMEPRVVRFFRGEYWTPKMLRWAAERINQAAADDQSAEEQRGGQVRE
jgi:hypothetical protein